MIITNRFDLKKIEGTISNGNIIYDIGINKETLTKDIVNEESQSGSKCTIKIEEEK